MSEDDRRRSRLRWLTLGEAVAVAAVAISGVGLWNSYQERRETRADKAAEAAREATPAPFALRAAANADGSALSLSAVSDGQAIQGQSVRFPPSFAVSPATTTSDARIEADWFADALRRDRKGRALPDETRGDERMPVLIETDYLADGRAMKARAFYDVGYALEGRFLRGSAVALRGLSLIGRAPAGDAAADRRLAALWAARAGTARK